MNEDFFKRVCGLLEGFFKLAGAPVEFSREEKDNYLLCRVQAGGDFLRKGEEMGLINALQYVVNRSLNGENDKRLPRVVLDVNECRARREEKLAALAEKLAVEVRESGEEKILEPLDPRERRVVHLAIAQQEGVGTHSVGDDYLKNVVIYKAGD